MLQTVRVSHNATQTDSATPASLSSVRRPHPTTLHRRLCCKLHTQSPRPKISAPLPFFFHIMTQFLPQNCCNYNCWCSEGYLFGLQWNNTQKQRLNLASHTSNCKKNEDKIIVCKGSSCIVSTCQLSKVNKNKNFFQL